MNALRAILLLALAAVSLPAAAHGGPVDSDGCHKDRTRGGYHCHRGALKGEVFASRDAMLKELHRRERQSNSSSGR